MTGSDLIRILISPAARRTGLSPYPTVFRFMVLVLRLMAVGTAFNPAAMALVPQIVLGEELPYAHGLWGSARQSAAQVGLR
jgi:hypothetical protein